MPSNIPRTPNLHFRLLPDETGCVCKGPLATIGNLFSMVAMDQQFGCSPGDLRLLPDHSSLPELIEDVDVTMQDINAVLFVIDKLPNIEKAHTLMACLMPIWLAIRLTPPPGKMTMSISIKPLLPSAGSTTFLLSEMSMMHSLLSLTSLGVLWISLSP